MMRITKVAAAVAISTGLLMGCNGPEVINETETGGGGETTPVSPLVGSNWSFGDTSNVAATATSTDLPNVYVFDGNNVQKYYDDDATPGTYTIYTDTYVDGFENDPQTIDFVYYDANGANDITGATFTVTDGNLVIDTANFDELSAVESADTAVADAIKAANALAGDNNSVQILDTLTTDTGELRLKLSDSAVNAAETAITSGKLTVDFIYQLDEDTEQGANGEGDNSYISFYASGTSKANLHGEIILSEGKVQYRNANGDITEAIGDESGIGSSFTPGDKLAIEAMWDNGTFTFTVNGESFTGEVADNTPVQVIALRLGDNGNTTNYEVVADNLKVYSNDVAADTLIFEDDFESYSPGPIGSPYNNNTSEATVISSGGDTTDPVEPGDVTDDFESYTVGALISDASSAWTTANIKDDDAGTTTAEVAVDPTDSAEKSLYLEDKNSATKPFAMRAFTAPAAAGSVSVDAYFPSTNTKSTYINIGDGKNNSDRYFELNQSGTNLKYEAGDNDVTIASGIELDTWHSLTISWTDAGLVSVTMNGQQIATDVAQSSTGLDSSIVPSQLTLYTGDNGSIVNTAYFDNVDSDLF
ncbi:hypothetical protein [Vibrio methylphosphonaticus]|uniref:hypothetical protein n=1 Tax=Vibrio methylphosphonaticus TaxID=2946866 RepID=UPI00202A93DA|nr:hypothetical protein [Vibrio methylphosphonaticus]MCL9777300.1 hypothetical protein [Vibrio methylphosphonaticus]